MRRLLHILIFLLLSNTLFSQTTSEKAEKIAVFCKVWGFLKYYHPVVAKGKPDWDQEFLTRINTLDSLHTKKETSDYYLAWIGVISPSAPAVWLPMHVTSGAVLSAISVNSAWL